MVSREDSERTTIKRGGVEVEGPDGDGTEGMGAGERVGVGCKSIMGVAVVEGILSGMQIRWIRSPVYIRLALGCFKSNNIVNFGRGQSPLIDDNSFRNPRINVVNKDQRLRH